MAQIKANGIEIEYDIHGPADGEPLLLIMGLGAQMTRWPLDFVEEFTSGTTEVPGTRCGVGDSDRAPGKKVSGRSRVT